MADKKDYTAGNGKRWLIGLGVIVLIAIIIVAIVLLIPANTTSATELLNKSTSTSFMVSQNEIKNYDAFELKVANSKKVNNYLTVMPNEMADIQTISLTIAEIFEHYNEYIIFVENTKGYKENYKDIKNGLSGTIESQKRLNEIMAEVNKLSELSPTYLQNAWIDFREEYVVWLENAKNAVHGLAGAYQEGMGNSTINNLASTTILNTVCDYVDVIYDGFKAIKEREVVEPNRTDYEYTLQGKVLAFSNFTNRYLEDDEDIKNYYFDETIKTTFANIEEYFTLYNETNMINAISSIEYISGRAVVSKIYDGIEDTKGVYNSVVKAFLLGGK